MMVIAAGDVSLVVCISDNVDLDIFFKNLKHTFVRYNPIKMRCSTNNAVFFVYLRKLSKS